MFVDWDSAHRVFRAVMWLVALVLAVVVLTAVLPSEHASHGRARALPTVVQHWP